MPVVVHRDAQGRFARAADAVRNTVVGDPFDLGPAPKGEGVPPFPHATCVETFPDGMKLARMMTSEDLAVLSANGGGCSKDHGYWVEHGRSEFFFVLVNKGSVGTILFCKRRELCGKQHPDESKPGFNGRCGWITSNYYDGGWGSTPRRYRDDFGDGGYWKDRLVNAKRAYEAQKKKALSVGPLGRDNPYKYDVDQANRYVIDCQKRLDAIDQQTKVEAGIEFMYDGNHLFIIQVAGRGVDYSGKNTRYTNKLADWLKERAVK